MRNYHDLVRVCEDLNEHANLKMGVPKTWTIKQYWDQAVRLNRKQNLMARDGDDNYVARFNVKDEDTKDLVWIGVTANNAYSRMTWFKIIVACEYFVYTRQMVKKYVLKEV